MSKINQAFILAAGRGERMKPLTNNIPKPLAKIKDKSVIDYTISKVSALPTIDKIIVNSYYLADILEEHLNSLNNPKIIISSENEKLETGGGLVNALPLFDQTKPILIINGDLFWIDQNNPLLQKMIDSFDEQKMDILLALKPKDQFFFYDGNGDFDFNQTTGELIRTNKTHHSHIYIGIQIVHPRIFKNKPEDKAFSLNYFFKQAQREDGVLNKVRAIEVEEQAFHISTIADLSAINAMNINM